jgi:hypothetical protein
MSIQGTYDSAKQTVADFLKPITDKIDVLAQDATTQINELQQAVDTAAALNLNLQQRLDQQLTPVSGMHDCHLHVDLLIGVGPDIAPLNPKLVQGMDYGFRQMQKVGGSDRALVLYFDKSLAGDYSGFLVHLHRRPVEREGGRLVWTGRIFHDDRAAAGMQALEFDTLLTKAGYKYNLSSQINYAKGGMLQLVNDASGNKGWQDVISVPKLISNQWNVFQWEYRFNTKSADFGYVALTLNGVRYPIPAGKFTSQSPTMTSWSEGLHMQLQIGTNAKGQPFSVAFDDLDYSYGS